ncbi:hypothetical protein PR048_022947 [Dryococelus australis]|uniref:Uncharacterized protein n=1 Tax=Dryococelus australis TaxID=614101 RepID=A0ABQ9GSN6_9NEOP|nr:hypothetical protein PR048_022947 [Dryococelus australis]
MLGNVLWIMLFVGLLTFELSNACKIFGYVYDGSLLICRDSRHDVEAKVEEALEKISVWSQTSNAIMLKEALKRTHIVRIEGRLLRFVSSIKYLGVVVGEHLSFQDHVRCLANKAVLTFHRLRVVTPAAWELNFFRYNVAAQSHMRRTLLKAQRVSLLIVAMAYMAVSHDALHVLIVGIPVDLLIQER